MDRQASRLYAVAGYLGLTLLQVTALHAGELNGVSAGIRARDETFDDGASYVDVRNNNNYEVDVKIHILASGAHGCALEKNLTYHLTAGQSVTDLIQLCPTGWIAMNRRTLQLISVDQTASKPRSTTSLDQQASASSTPLDAAGVWSLQVLLTRLGYAPGPADGILGAKENSRTKVAIRAFQKTHNLEVTGRASAQLLETIRIAVDVKGMSPNQIYVKGVQHETRGEKSMAKNLYSYLMQVFPTSDVSVKAADRVVALRGDGT